VGGGGGETVGELVVRADGFKAVQAGARSSGQIRVGNLKTALVNATGQNQPLVPDMRVPGVVFPVQRRLTVRDLLPSFPTASNLVQFARETAFTNNAGPQTGGSPNSGENVAKAESALTFDLANAPVQTLAHWIPASRQILDDAPALTAYIDSRLMYGLKLKEEDELLNGSGTGNHLSGLITNSTPYDLTRTTVGTDTFIDVLSHAMTQLTTAEIEADGVVLNPSDWESIRLTKETGTGITSGMYLLGDPRVSGPPRLFGVPVVLTNSMARSQFLVGNFAMAAAIWDRADATVEISREHSDFFTKNMVALLCESRLALTVFRPLAMIFGGFPWGS
jgi:HK97 family phage major capsid protein